MIPAFLLAAGGDAWRLPFEMLVVVGSARVLAEVFERMKQPGLVGQILAGVLMGPAVLGWLKPNEVLTSLAELGVMFLLFRVGLEMESHELMKVGRTGMVVAMLGVVVPFGMGWGILTLWGAPSIEAIFVGAAMVATSVGITAEVLASKGLLDTAVARLILAAAIIDDVLGLLVLAVVSSMAKGQVNVAQLILTAGMAVAFTFLVARWGGPAMSRVVPKVQASVRSGEGHFSVAMILLFGLSVIAVWAGVAAIIGAFLAGMALAGTGGERFATLVDGVTELLLPFFLVGIGMNLEWRAFVREPALTWLALAVLAAAVVSKLAGCGLGAASLGFRGAFQVGCGMVPRGEVGMVVAQIGLGLGVISSGVYGVVVAMAVLTTMAAPPLLAYAFRPANSRAALQDQ